jgi:flagellar hook-length control protein FliK
MANVNVEEGTATAATVAPPPPSEQLVSVLTPLRSTQSGSYTLRLELKPPELGRVEMRVEMRDGVLHASIHAEHQSSAQQLRDALGDLRDRLGAEGVRTGDLTVSDGSVGSRHNEGGRASESPDAGPQPASNDELTPPDATPVTPPLDSEAASLLDVRV